MRYGEWDMRYGIWGMGREVWGAWGIPSSLGAPDLPVYVYIIFPQPYSVIAYIMFCVHRLIFLRLIT